MFFSPLSPTHSTGATTFEKAERRNNHTHRYTHDLRIVPHQLRKHDFTTWADLRARFRADSPLVAGDLGSSCLTYQQLPGKPSKLS